MNKSKKPTLFNSDDTNIKITPEPEVKNVNTVNQQQSTSQNTKSPLPKAGQSNSLKPKLISWGFLLFSSLTGLVILWLGAAIISSVEQLFNRQDLIGWAALAMASVALFSFLILIAREIIALTKLKKLGKLKSTGQQVHNDNQLASARLYLGTIKKLYEKRPQNHWHISRLEERETEIMDGRELIELIDKEIGQPLDEKAQKIISETARKVSLVTAIAPGPLLDMAAITMLNISMIRKISQIYGVRPGFWGLSRLGRNIITHLALTGGIAITSDLLHPLIGSGIAAKLSKKLGEGLFNGALTIRIGISAQEITRPIPQIVVNKLSFTQIVSSSLKSNKT